MADVKKIQGYNIKDEEARNSIQTFELEIDTLKNSMSDANSEITSLKGSFNNLDNSVRSMNNELDNLNDDVQLLKNYVTPEMFGAIGDGSYDDTTPLQNMLNNGGKILFGKNKTYKITRTLKLTSNTSIDMNGSMIQLLSANPTDMIEIQDCINVTIKNGSLKGVWKTGYESLAFICLISSSKNVTIENCSFTNNISDGIYIGYKYSYDGKLKYTTENITIDKCTIEDVGRNGIALVSGDHVIIKDCKFKDIYDNAPKSCIDIEPEKNASTNQPLHLKDIRIHGCIFENTTENQSTQGLYIFDNGLVSKADIHVHDCVFNNTVFVYDKTKDAEKGFNVSVNQFEFINNNAIYCMLISNPCINYPIIISNVNIRGTKKENTDMFYYGAISIDSEYENALLGGVCIDTVNVSKDKGMLDFKTLIQVDGNVNGGLYKNITLKNIYCSTDVNNLILPGSELIDYGSCVCDSYKTIHSTHNYYEQDIRGGWNLVMNRSQTAASIVKVHYLLDGIHRVNVLSFDNGAGIGLYLQNLNYLKFADNQNAKNCYLNQSKNIEFMVKDGLIYILKSDYQPVYS